MVTLQVCYAFFLMLGAVGESLRMQACLLPHQSCLCGRCQTCESFFVCRLERIADVRAPHLQGELSVITLSAFACTLQNSTQMCG